MPCCMLYYGSFDTSDASVVNENRDLDDLLKHLNIAHRSFSSKEPTKSLHGLKHIANNIFFSTHLRAYQCNLLNFLVFSFYDLDIYEFFLPIT